MIAMDGPAASGKSTVARLLAERLGYLVFDTGVMYRAVTWAALAQGLAPGDEATIGALAEHLALEIAYPTANEQDGRLCTVRVDGLDVTWALRAGEVERYVSVVSAHKRVRTAMVARQRAIGLHYAEGRGDRSGIVMVGRDIGTVVLPEAPLKIYLDASAEERARRRHRELVARATPDTPAPPFQQVLDEIIARDTLDSGRAVSPLRPAADAVRVDTTGLTPQEVVEQILALMR